MPPGMTLIVENRGDPEEYHAKSTHNVMGSGGQCGYNNYTPTGLSDRASHTAVLLLC